MSARLALGLAVLVLGGACGGPWYQRYGIKDEKELHSYRALPKLQRALERGSCHDLLYAGQALEEIGARAYTIQESMQRSFLRDECRNSLREPLARALGRLGGRAVDFLATHQKSPDLSLRSLAVIGLAEVRDDPARIVPLLVEASGWEKENVVWSLGITDPRKAALAGLGHLGVKAAPALPTLLRALTDEDLAPSAAVALGEMGLARPEVIAALHDYALKVSDEDEKRRVVADLERLQPGAGKDIPLPPEKKKAAPAGKR